MHGGPDRAERGSGGPDDSRRCLIEPVCIVVGIIGEFADGRVVSVRPTTSCGVAAEQ